MSKDIRVDNAMIDLKAIAKLSELKEPRNALLIGLLHCKARLIRELPNEK